MKSISTLTTNQMSPVQADSGCAGCQVVATDGMETYTRVRALCLMRRLET